jgi:hypothetical protein
VPTCNVVHGFHVSQISPFRSPVHQDPPPAPTKSSLYPAKGNYPKNEHRIFFAEASSKDSSLEETISIGLPQQRSSAAELNKFSQDKKQTSFEDEIESRTINNRSSQDGDVFEPKNKNKHSFESAIDEDEDSSDWEDSATHSGGSSINEKIVYHRVDCRPNNPSQRSFLTALIRRPDRDAALATPFNRRPRAPSNAPSITASFEDNFEDPSVSRSDPITMPGVNTSFLALSPRSIRRHMLATELTKSLRGHLLWERQQQNITANAIRKRKRKHTGYDPPHIIS